MKKSIILIIFLISSFGFSGNKNISFIKQKKYQQEIREEEIKKPSIEETQKESKYIPRLEKLIDYIKTQNQLLSYSEIRYIIFNVWKYSKENDYNPYIILSVMNVESHFRHSTVSKAGARGLMQLMPFNFREFGVNNSIEGNIKGGILHLKRDFEKQNKDIIKALVCYNAGCSKLKNNEWQKIKETREYIPKVLKKYQEISNL